MADSEDFDEFYRGTSPRLLRYAYAMSGDIHAAQDLVQEAYVRAWQRWAKVSRYDQTEAWLRMVVARLATDRWRRIGVRRRAAAAQAPPDPVAPPSEATVLLVTALRTLPEAQRRALVLYYLLDLSIAEVATETGTSVGTVKSWLSRGRAALGEALGEPTGAGDGGQIGRVGESDPAQSAQPIPLSRLVQATEAAHLNHTPHAGHAGRVAGGVNDA